MAEYEASQMRLISDSIDFGLNGVVSLEQAGTALSALNDLLRGLAAEVAEDSQLTWSMERLEGGSLAAAVAFQSPDPSVISAMTDAYGQVGLAMEYGNVIPFDRARGPAKKLAGLITNGVESMYFGTGTITAIVEETAVVKQIGPTSIESIGTVTGTLRTLSSGQTTRAWVVDAVRGYRVPCHLSDEYKERARELWDKPVIVEGVIRRSIQTGRPISVSKIRRIELWPEVAPGSWRDVVGLFPRKDGDPRAEDIIRKLRDAE